MRPTFIKFSQRQTILLLRSASPNKSLSLYHLSQDNCSEVSRLIGCWLLKKYPKSSITVIKGNQVMRTKKAHDVLIVGHNHHYYILDPTIWQFFPRKKSIFVGISESMKGCLEILPMKYGGTWSASEKMSKNICSVRNIKSLLKTIKETATS